MTSTTSWARMTIFSLALPLLISGCGHRAFGPPVTSASQCALQWDWVDNLAVAEYRVTLWPDQKTPDPPKHTYHVPAPNTIVPCAAVGANHDGTWWATVQACTKKGICGVPSAPFTFIVSTK